MKRLNWIFALLLIAGCHSAMSGPLTPRDIGAYVQDIRGVPHMLFGDASTLTVMYVNEDNGHMGYFRDGRWLTPPPQTDEGDVQVDRRDVLRIPLFDSAWVLASRNTDLPVIMVGEVGAPCDVGEGCDGVFGNLLKNAYASLYSGSGSAWTCPVEPLVGIRYATQSSCNAECRELDSVCAEITNLGAL